MATRKLTDNDLRALDFLGNTSHDEAIEWIEHKEATKGIGKDFKLKIKRCKEVITVEEFRGLKKSLIDMLRRPTFIRIDNGIVCLAIPVLRGENDGEKNEKAAIFINFDAKEDKLYACDFHLFWSCQQGAVSEKEFSPPKMNDGVEIFLKLIENEAVKINGFTYQTMIEEDEESSSIEENSLSTSEMISDKEISFYSTFNEEGDNSVSEPEESQETKTIANEEKNNPIPTLSLVHC